MKKEMMKGTMEINSVFFLPNLSAAYPAKKGPIAAPTGNKDPIQDSCSLVRGFDPRGFLSGSISPFSFGISGDVQPNAVPQTKEQMFAETKYISEKLNTKNLN